ncbi:MAG: 50S ribosomal protein L3 [uncultured bacterium]|nr:MAG: 50S ribosomal protein L3 [uncultured bacterium]OGH13750.1 MAG: 50S ribosomal protein L3 [Candidatus Levybacteria bacterium RIFCSPHIGHO2_01_FULL_38_26]
MALQALLGKKIEQSQRFLEDGTRIPVTRIQVSGNVVVSVKTKDKNGYDAVQIGFGTKKKPDKALLGIVKKANLKTAPYTLKEVKYADADGSAAPSISEAIKALEVFKPGDIVDVIGISKGKGFAGVVKRHHFKGGPRTHGQSDRERAPGSIGQTTTPGRVYKGKKMAGRMGADRVTLQNLQLIDVSDDTLLIKGLVPGGRNNLLTIKKVREAKKFIPLYKEPEETKEPQEEVKKEEKKEDGK